MKKILIIAFCALISVHCFAQRDIKTLDYIGASGIIKILGEPTQTDGWADCDILWFVDGTTVHVNATTGRLERFGTTSPNYCVLSDYIKGGFKVGDKFSKVKAFDFVHSKYGKNRSGNALKFVNTYKGMDQYKVYGEEKICFYFRIKNGLLVEIGMSTAEEDYGFDLNNKPW